AKQIILVYASVEGRCSDQYCCHNRKFSNSPSPPETQQHSPDSKNIFQRKHWVNTYALSGNFHCFPNLSVVQLCEC
uniref:Uncharacterized protein n=1 Tax=Esox lucius TaxID=8010 RepID=A0AAY5K9J9_ESOLU